MSRRIDDVRRVAEKVYVANCNGANLSLGINEIQMEVRDRNNNYESIMERFPRVVYFDDFWQNDYEECVEDLLKALDRYL